MSQLTVTTLKEVLPKSLHVNATQELADRINNIATDPLVAKEVRENFLTYSRVLSEGKFKTDDYLNAVTYTTYKLMGYTNKDSYIRTFPDRYSALVAKGTEERTISAYVSMYHKNKLVQTILEQSMIPAWLLNQDTYQRAINVQLGLMTDEDVSPKVRQEAANSLLTHLKPPEVKKVEIDVGVRSDGGMQDLRATLYEMAATQKMMIEGGQTSAKSVAAQELKIVDAEFKDV